MRRVLISIVSIFVVGMIILTVLTIRRSARDGGDTIISDGTSRASTTSEFFPVSPNILQPSHQEAGTTGNTAVEDQTSVNEIYSESNTNLRRVAKNVAGYEIFGSTNNLDLVLRYIERETGHVYEHLPHSGILTRLTNTTIPKIQSVYWGGKDTLITTRTNENEESSVEEMRLYTTLGGTGQLRATPLPSTIKTIARANDGKTFFFLETMLGGGSKLRTQTTTATDSKVLLESSLSEWKIVPTDKNIYLQTRASAFAEGYLFRVSAGSLEKILGGIRGLTARISPNEQYIMYAENSADQTQTETVQDYASGIRTTIYDVKTKEVQVSPVQTLPEKCTWSRKNTDRIYCAAPKNLDLRAYPDSWYQGEISFNDTLWIVNISTGSAVEILDPTAIASEEIDMIDLRLSVDDTYIFFRNKKDGGLWQFKIQ